MKLNKDNNEDGKQQILNRRFMENREKNEIQTSDKITLSLMPNRMARTVPNYNTPYNTIRTSHLTSGYL